MFSTIVSTSTLASHLDDPSWLIVDCRFDLTDPPKGGRLYAEGHLPRAHYVGLEPDLSGPKTGTSGRHPLPSVGDFARVIERLGVTPATQVVAYDDKTGLWASRLWWMLRAIGHDRVAVLDGGLANWIAEGRPTSTQVAAPQHVARPAGSSPYRADWTAHAALDDVVSLVGGTTKARLVDARAPERYRGESESIDRVAGHIPGAVNYFFQRSLNADGTFLPPDALRANWSETLAGHTPAQTICYCGSGVTACHTLLSMEIAGLGGARLYPGSWSEWSSDPTRPVATGTES